MDIVSQIRNSLYKGRNDNIKAASASASSQAAKSGEAKAISLSALNPGDIFLGEVTDVKGQSVTIRVADGGQLYARLGEQMPVNIGDALRFMVRENSTEQLLLKVLPNQEMQQMSAVAERALTAGGFSLSEKNGNIVKALMEAGEPLDKANIMKLLQQSYKFPEARLETLVAMNKLELPVTEENIRQFDSYMNYSHQVSGTISSMADTLVRTFSDMADSGSLSDLLGFHGQLMDIIGPGGEPLPEDGLLMFRQMMEAKLAGTEAPDIDFSGIKMEIDEDGFMKVVPGEQGIRDIPDSALMEYGASDKPEVAPKESLPVTDSENTVVIDNKNLRLNNQELASISNALQKAGLSPQQTAGLLQNAASPEALLNQLSFLMPNLREADIRNLLKSEGYGRLLNESVKSAWSIRPEKMKEAKEIDELYDKLQRDMQRLSSSLEDKGAGGQEFSRQSQHMQEQMKFMQDLNQNFIYAQMPIKLSENVTNSELYVYADKKKLVNKKDNISVLFHLDMDNLGPTDVYVSLSGKNVHAVFTFQDQKSVRIVASNMSSLAEKLMEKGLKLSHEVKKKPEVKVSPVVEEIIDPGAEKSVKRYNFDVRG